MCASSVYSAAFAKLLSCRCIEMVRLSDLLDCLAVLCGCGQPAHSSCRMLLIS
jgi:hypothetical protein